MIQLFYLSRCLCVGRGRWIHCGPQGLPRTALPLQAADAAVAGGRNPIDSDEQFCEGAAASLGGLGSGITGHAELRAGVVVGATERGTAWAIDAHDQWPHAPASSNGRPGTTAKAATINCALKTALSCCWQGQRARWRVGGCCSGCCSICLLVRIGLVPFQVARAAADRSLDGLFVGFPAFGRQFSLNLQAFSGNIALFFQLFGGPVLLLPGFFNQGFLLAFNLGNFTFCRNHGIRRLPSPERINRRIA